MYGDYIYIYILATIYIYIYIYIYDYMFNPFSRYLKSNGREFLRICQKRPSAAADMMTMIW